MKGVSQSWLRGRDRSQIPSGLFVGPVVCVEAVQILTVVGFMQPPSLLALHAINFAVADYACFWTIYYVNIPCQVSEVRFGVPTVGRSAGICKYSKKKSAECY